MNFQELARNWRENNNYEANGGVVIIYDNTVNGWSRVMPEPCEWRPGTIAIDENGKEWLAVNGNDQNGAKKWEPLNTQ